MDFEKAKELLKESIDEGANLFEIMEIFTDKVYEQGKQDGKDSEQIASRWLNWAKKNTG